MGSKGGVNQLACIDYKEPIGARNDYRTSTYVAHRYIPDPVHITQRPGMAKKETCQVLARTEMAYDFTTEQKAAFTNKFVDYTQGIIPSLMVKNVHYMKPYDEQFFCSAPRPINGFESRYKTDYVAKTLPEENIEMNWICPPKVKKSQVVIDPALPGSSKYLDMLATTNTLTYFAHTPESVTSPKDIITLWNWLGFRELRGGIKRELPENFSGTEESLCQNFPSQDCPKRREIQTRLKHVPHRGLTTETRTNYVLPEHKVDFKFEDVQMPIQFTDRRNLQKFTTEAQIYGSKQRIQKYVDVGGMENKYYGTCQSRATNIGCS